MLPRSLLVFNKIATIVASTLAYIVTTLPIAIGTRPCWPAVLTVLRSASLYRRDGCHFECSAIAECTEE